MTQEVQELADRDRGSSALVICAIGTPSRYQRMHVAHVDDAITIEIPPTTRAVPTSEWTASSDGRRAQHRPKHKWLTNHYRSRNRIGSPFDDEHHPHYADLAEVRRVAGADAVPGGVAARGIDAADEVLALLKVTVRSLRIPGSPES